MKWATLLLAVLAAGAAGCGGGGSSGPHLTRAELIAKGDAICTTFKKKNHALNQNAPAKNPTDPSATDAQVKAYAPILEQLATNLRSARADLAKLNPPADTESDWNNTLDDLDQLASKLDNAAQSARALDRQRVVNEYGGILRLNHRITTFEQDYGFKVCGAQS